MDKIGRKKTYLEEMEFFPRHGPFMDLICIGSEIILPAYGIFRKKQV
ncbi:MAG: hypothetical protein HUK40_11955 [Desulfobacter sp.]|nr:hypothetical protein [Desulfobacter sp.]WDP84021.1 MAG: hypothetical protein HUN05_01635 [Desulfobacter sp.]